MKKSKIKMLTAAACLALVGTASAAWVYAGTATESANIGVKVASYASAGSITVSGADKINVLLDKGSITFVRDSSEDTLTATHTVPSEFSGATNEVFKQYSVVISPKLATYVTFNSSYGTNITKVESDTTFGSVTIEAGSIYLSDSSSEKFKWKDGVDVFDNLPSLTWASSMEPSVQNDYWNMINYFKSGTIDADNWDNVQNNEWNVTTDLNCSAYVQIIFSAVVQTA